MKKKSSISSQLSKAASANSDSTSPGPWTKSSPKRVGRPGLIDLPATARASRPPITPEAHTVFARIAERQRADVEAAIAAAAKARPSAKQLVATRLDPDVLAWLKGFGDGYSTRINGILRAVMERRFEDTLQPQAK